MMRNSFAAPGIAVLVLASAALWLAGETPAQLPSDCGLMPIPEPHCEIGACVDGEWEQKCVDNPFSECGIKPNPPVDCYVGDCVDGQWQTICGADGHVLEPEADPCGPKPLPPAGCRIEACEYGVWQMTCH